MFGVAWGWMMGTLTGNGGGVTGVKLQLARPAVAGKEAD